MKHLSALLERCEFSTHQSPKGWTCYGEVRGCCGVLHRTRQAAERHCARDQAGVRSRYPATFPTLAYSDRYPVPIGDPDDYRPEDERDEG